MNFRTLIPYKLKSCCFLTAEDAYQQDWRKCLPRTGSVFIVGDPKQSIYRFRRADIVTYDQVKEVVLRSGGEVLNLSVNFRTVEPLVSWVNGVFESAFREHPKEMSPDYVRLIPIRTLAQHNGLSGIKRLPIPTARSYATISEQEADIQSRSIRDSLAAKVTIPRSTKEIDSGETSEIRPGDVLIVTKKKQRLGVYASKLQEMAIPHQVTGGDALNQSEELNLLAICMNAATQPDNPVALVAALQSELFGLGDVDLYEFRRGNGRFTFNAEVPQELPEEIRSAFEDAFSRLRNYASWLRKLPAVAAMEKVIEDLGLIPRAGIGAAGEVRSGSMLKAVELVRNALADSWSISDLTNYLERLISGKEPHDASPARPYADSMVRVMNLHKVKGLEAPIVFLADPSGNSEHSPEIHVDRSSEDVKGYMLISEGSETLARPENWERCAERETLFSRAEETRLLYVAATRAGSGLVVSQRIPSPTARKSKKDQTDIELEANKLNPWGAFCPHLPRDDLADPGPQEPQPRPTVNLTPDDVRTAKERIARRWERSLEKTYDTVAAKAAVVQMERVRFSADSHGAEWGSVIHYLLEAAMLNPSADLNSLAMATLEEYGLDAGLTDLAVETARAVGTSEIWRRALASEKRFVEIPFQYLSETEGALKTIVRGVIDLVFKDELGWTLVDYKTDRISEFTLEESKTIYAPQLQEYCNVWEKITGEKVNEAGLYFTRMRRYVRL